MLTLQVALAILTGQPIGQDGWFGDSAFYYSDPNYNWVEITCYENGNLTVYSDSGPVY